MPHNGTDFGAPTGTPVGASSPGVVASIGYDGASGNLVTIDHAGGYTTGYAHLSRFAEGLKVGDHVSRLQLIGYVGSTGRSTGPHLHFSAKKDGKFIDAESLQLDALRVLPKEERDEFAVERKTYDQLLEAIPLPRRLERAASPAAAVPPAEADPGLDSADESDDPDDVEESAPIAALAGESKAAPAPPAASPTKPAVGGARPIYLTDKQLMEMQCATDDGEVEE
jgi:murein DD-endopeptidase MepM/ murein hydrolase activator NlpD